MCSGLFLLNHNMFAFNVNCLEMQFLRFVHFSVIACGQIASAIIVLSKTFENASMVWKFNNNGI